MVPKHNENRRGSTASSSSSEKSKSKIKSKLRQLGLSESDSEDGDGIDSGGGGGKTAEVKEAEGVICEPSDQVRKIHELSESDRSGSSSPNLSDIEEQMRTNEEPSEKVVAKVDDDHDELVAWLENVDKERAGEEEAMRERIKQKEAENLVSEI